jgi:hypothetical protein
MHRLTAAIALVLLAMSAQAADLMSDPRSLRVNEHLVKLCATWQRVNAGLAVSRDQLYEAGLCQGYLVGVVPDVISELCAEHSRGMTPGWNIQAAVPIMMRIWWGRASREKSFQITSPRHIVTVVVEEMLGPKGGWEQKCRSVMPLGMELPKR